MAFNRRTTNKETNTPKKKDLNSTDFTVGTLRDPDGVLNLPEKVAEGVKMPYIVLNKNVQIMVDGKELDLGEFNTLKLFDAQNSVLKLEEKGFMNEQQANEKLDYIQQKGILFNIVRYLSRK